MMYTSATDSLLRDLITRKADVILDMCDQDPSTLPRAFMGESMYSDNHSLPCSSEALTLGTPRLYKKRKLKIAVMGANQGMHRHAHMCTCAIA